MEENKEELPWTKITQFLYETTLSSEYSCGWRSDLHDLHNFGYFLKEHQAQAGAAGAQIGLSALYYLLNFFDLDQNQTLRTKEAIQNLKIFLGEKDES